MDWGFLLHPEATLRKLYDEVHSGPGEPAAHTSATTLSTYSALLDGSADRLQQAVRGVGVDWRGQAADRTSAAVQRMTRWAGQSGGPAGEAARTNVGHYGASFTVFRNKVEPPLPTPNVNFTLNPLVLGKEGADAMATALENYRRLANAGVAYLQHKSNSTGALGAITEPSAVPDVVNQADPHTPAGPGAPTHTPPGGTPGGGPPGGGRSPGAQPAPPGGGAGQPVPPGAGQPNPPGGADQGKGAGPGTNPAPPGGTHPSTHTQPSTYTPPAPTPPTDPDSRPAAPAEVTPPSAHPAPPPPLPAPPGYQPGSIARALGTTVRTEPPAPRGLLGPPADPALTGAAAPIGAAEATAARTGEGVGPGGVPIGPGGTGHLGQRTGHKNRTFIPSDEPFRVDIDHLVTAPVLGLDHPDREDPL